jgi:hypothetical protein
MFPFSLMASEAPNDWSTEKCTIIRSVILGLRLQLSTWVPLLFGSFGLFQQFSGTCGRSDFAITLATTLFLFPQNTKCDTHVSGGQSLNEQRSNRAEFSAVY